MKQSLQLRLSQSLTLTPQLQQSIRLLQLSTLELNQELAQFQALNPFLEVTEPSLGSEADAEPDETDSDVQLNGSVADAESGFNLGEFSSTRAASSEDDEDRDPFALIAAKDASLTDHLLQQLNVMPLLERDRRFAMVIVAHLDDDGYFKQNLAELGEELKVEFAPDWGIDPEELDDELRIALKRVQSLDPVGVAAESIGDCLRLQLMAMPDDTPYRDEAIIAVTQQLEALATRDFIKLKRTLKVNDEGLKALRELIVTLDPKPGRQFSVNELRHIIPDVLVRKSGGKWIALINPEAVPRVRLNKLYADIVSKSRGGSGKEMSGHLQEARWMIKNVQQRFETILRVTQAIVERQRNFFEHGEVAMKPLVLREIADQVELHESTISRVTTQKYMLTTRGLYELKYFFGSHVSTDTGGACSATAIRALIKELVGKEDTKKPLSDNKIADMLGTQGIVVARRTVAKYREAMMIAPASQRKSV